MKNHTQESLEEARLRGVWDRQDRKAIQDHFDDDVELHAAYLDGYDPNGEIVKKIDCPNCADQTSNDDGEIDELIEEIPTDVHYEPNEPNLSENNEVQDLTSIEFFVANVKSYHASVFGVYCSNCFESESTIAVTTNNYTMFEFCKPCYDKLKRAMIARDARS